MSRNIALTAALIGGIAGVMPECHTLTMPPSPGPRGRKITPSKDQGYRIKGGDRNALCGCGSGKKAKRCGCGGPAAMIRTFDDPVLHQVCEPVGAGEDLAWLRSMRAACEASGSGVGLAAPQIGIAKRACWISPTGVGGWYMVNPEIIWWSDTTRRDQEHCLSYPGHSADIERHDSVQVEYEDEHRQRYVHSFHGWTARIIQHEIDHLDGICKVGEAWVEGKVRQALAAAGDVDEAGGMTSAAPAGKISS